MLSFSGLSQLMSESKFPRMPLSIDGMPLDQYIDFVRSKYDVAVAEGVPGGIVNLHKFSNYVDHTGRKVWMNWQPRGGPRLDLPVFISVNNVQRTPGSYDYETRTVHLSDKLGGVSFREVLVHELVHALDPKMQVPGYTGRMIEKGQVRGPTGNMQDFRAYAISPHEFDASSTWISTLLRDGMRSDPDMATRLADLLRGDFDRDGLARAAGIDQKLLPPEIDDWKTKPSLWKRFRQRLQSLLDAPKPQETPFQRRKADIAKERLDRKHSAIWSMIAARSAARRAADLESQKPA